MRQLRLLLLGPGPAAIGATARVSHGVQRRSCSGSRQPGREACGGQAGRSFRSRTVAGAGGNIMCRLFGLTAGAAPVRATFWLLDAPDSLEAQARGNVDGSGVGFFDSPGEPVLDKEPEPAFRDEAFIHAAKQAESTAFVAHVRWATAGGRTVRTTHPLATPTGRGQTAGAGRADPSRGLGGGRGQGRAVRASKTLPRPSTSATSVSADVNAFRIEDMHVPCGRHGASYFRGAFQPRDRGLPANRPDAVGFVR